MALVAKFEELGDRLAAVLDRPLTDALTQPPAADLVRWMEEDGRRLRQPATKRG